MTNKLLQLCNITKQYHYDDCPVIDGMSLELDSGVNTIIIDSQSGKSTLVKLILGLEKYQGKILLHGQDIDDITPKDRNIVVLDRALLMFRRKSALYNVAYPLLIRAMPKQQAYKMATQHLEQWGLSSLTKSKVSKLNKEQLIKLALARATLRHSDIILMDSFVDLISSQRISDVIERLTQFADNIISFTSDIDKACGNTILISDNEVIANGSKEEVADKMKQILFLYNVTKELHNGQ